jgi:hypothetical protein
MAVAVTTITNLSKQAVPVLVNEIPLAKTSESSDLPPGEARQLLIQPGASITVESRRLDQGQLDQLRRKGLLSYTSA